MNQSRLPNTATSRPPQKTKVAEAVQRAYYDNTKLSDYKDCPRYYYLRHERGWRGSAISKPLTFGLAWHSAMSVVWRGYRKLKLSTLPQVAMEAFWNTWVKEGGPKNLDLQVQEEWAARTPAVAEEMLINYLEDRGSILQKATLLHTEQPFAVPLFDDSADYFYIGRKDEKIILNGEGIVIEHKTTSEYKIDGGFKSTYIDQFSPNSQVEGYLWSEKHEKQYPAKMVWVDSALVHKKVHDAFKFIPISKVTAGLEGWLWEARDWVMRVESDLRRLYEEKQDGQTHMTAFPKNTEHCVGKYGTCQFLNICRSNPNPAKIKEPPEGYIEERWEPFDVLGLDKIMRK